MNNSFESSSEIWLTDDDDDAIVQHIKSCTNLIQQIITNQNEPSIRGGSIQGHRVINRDREVGDPKLFNDYFSKNPTFNETMFRRHFRMSRNLFFRIANGVKNHDNYFVQRRNWAGKDGLSTIQKVTAALRILAYGLPAYATDEYIRIRESTAIECVKRFFRDVIKVFGEQYLRAPMPADVNRWKNCPAAWAGQYSGRSGAPTIILEVVADYDLWIWHAYFGMARSNNDINVLEASNLFSNLTEGIAPPANYVIQGKEYIMGYYLADDIYPKWATLVQSIQDPCGPKKKYFAKRQESCRNDVERAFETLQAQFAIVAAPVRYWDKRVLHDIMTACIIMHNMIVEDEHDMDAPIQEAMEVPAPDVEMVDKDTQFQQFLKHHRHIKDKEVHYEFRNALIDHLWEEYSNSEK